MEEKEILLVGYIEDHYVAVDTHGAVVATIAPACTFEVWTADQWQAVTLHSGGYRGCYYETCNGKRGRLALCMRLRLLEASA